MIDPSLFSLPYDVALAHSLAGEGCDVTLYSRRLTGGEKAPAGIGLSALFYHAAESRRARGLPKQIRLVIKAIDHAVSMRRLWRHLQQARPDVIHFQWLPLPLLDGRMLPQFRKLAPLVYTVHDTDPFNGSPTARLQGLGTERALAGFSRLIVHTRQGLARLNAQGLPEQNLALLPHGLTGLTSVAEDSMQGELTLLLFGKMKSYKGADLLVAAFAALPAELRAQARVRIIGKPYMDLAPLRAQIRQSGAAERISLETRFVDDSEIPALMGPGTIVMFPYREIEASGVMYQALEFGRPVIASRLGAFADVLQDGVHGRLVTPGNVAELTEAMAGLIRNRQAAAKAATAVRQLASDSPNWNEVARRTVAVYRDARNAA